MNCNHKLFTVINLRSQSLSTLSMLAATGLQTKTIAGARLKITVPDNTVIRSSNMAPKIVLITGCSSGIGLATAVLLAQDVEKRFKVYATMKNLAKKEQLEEEGRECLGNTLIIKQLDVCYDDSVDKAVKEVIEVEGRIDVLCK